MIQKNGAILSLLFIAAVLCTGCSFAQDSGAAKIGVMDAADALGLKEFSAAVEGAGLADTLNNQGVLIIGSGSFVIFAPSDEAFAAVTDVDMNAIKENATELKRILSYHIVWNDGSFENISDLSSAKTLQGENLTIDSDCRHEDIWSQCHCIQELRQRHHLRDRQSAAAQDHF